MQTALAETTKSIEHETPTTPPAQRQRAPKGAVTTLDMLNTAVASGASMEVMERLMALHERWESSQARKAFDNAMADAKAEIPPILKNREVDFTSSKGRTHYRHEDLGEIARTVDPILAKHGLSYRFRTTSEANQPVSVTCIVAHRDGHSEANTLSAGRDESGNKNTIQAVGSTITYLQRYTLKAALGLAASNDDDGRAAGGASEPSQAISTEQRDELLRLIEDTATDVALFCRYYKIEAVPDLPAAKFETAKSQLVAKKGR